jgi:hypothetical protein
MKLLIFSYLFIVFLLLPTMNSQLTTTQAIVDPLSVSNNKFGIHIIHGTNEEIEPAQRLVNSNGGDWGYITVLIENKDRDQNKWQNVFNEFRRKHLIPIVRLATQPEGNSWKRPYEGEEKAWADFLNSLVWPTKNRYVVVYNEPNHGTEWGSFVDPADYAKTLDKTIDALKSKNPDFFILNAGFDASAPNLPPRYADQLIFMQQMNQAVPGIFNKLDGWSSHSYPNPGFIGSPNDIGRGTIQTYIWELQVLTNLGVNKTLPVFITETGWKHSEGQVTDKSLPTPETISKYYEVAFQNIWSDNRVAAVTPFLLDYQQSPFDHFSFKKIAGRVEESNVLGSTYPQFHPHYQKVMDLQKSSGHPTQEDKATLIQGALPSQLLVNQSYTIPLVFKNSGQSIWNEYGQVRLTTSENQALGIGDFLIPAENKIEPNQEFTFNLSLNPKTPGNYKVTIALFNNGQQFEEEKPLSFNIEVLSPTTSPSPAPKPNLISDIWEFISGLFSS